MHGFNTSKKWADIYVFVKVLLEHIRKLSKYLYSFGTKLNNLCFLDASFLKMDFFLSFIGSGKDIYF